MGGGRPPPVSIAPGLTFDFVPTPRSVRVHQQVWPDSEITFSGRNGEKVTIRGRFTVNAE